jgi:hypothetical protein
MEPANLVPEPLQPRMDGESPESLSPMASPASPARSDASLNAPTLQFGVPPSSDSETGSPAAKRHKLEDGIFKNDGKGKNESLGPG